MERITFTASKEIRTLAEEMLNKNIYSLKFVKDDGAYLMNYYTRTEEDKKFLKGNDFGNVFTYGDWVKSEKQTISLNPNKNKNVWEDSRSACGGDDFVEELELSEEMLLFMEVNTNYRFFIDISKNDVSYGLISGK